MYSATRTSLSAAARSFYALRAVVDRDAQVGRERRCEPEELLAADRRPGQPVEPVELVEVCAAQVDVGELCPGHVEPSDARPSEGHAPCLGAGEVEVADDDVLEPHVAQV